MVTNELTLLNEQLRSAEAFEREVAAMRLARAGYEGTRALAALALDAGATSASRLTAIGHLPADEACLPVLHRLLADPQPVLRTVALDKAEAARARTLIPLIQELTTDTATFWDLDEEIVVGAVARRVLDSLGVPGA